MAIQLDPPKKVSDTIEINENLNASDEFLVVDKSDTSTSSLGELKKVTYENLLANINGNNFVGAFVSADFGTINANSTKEIIVTINNILQNDWVVSSPVTTLPSGISVALTTVDSSNNTIIRLANCTTSSVVVGSVDLVVNKIMYPPLQVVAPPLQDFIPNDIASTQLWLEAYDATTISDTGGLVDTWTDKSPNAYSITATGTERPTTGVNNLNGSNVLDFNATSMTLPAGLHTLPAGANTFVFVTKNNGNNATSLIYALKAGSVFANTAYYVGADGLYYRNGTTNSGEARLLSFATNQYNIFVCTFDGVNAQKIYANGVEVASNNTGAVNNSIDLGTIGGIFSTLSLNGNVASINAFNEELSTQDREKMEGYLAHQLGIQSLLPTNHPYKNSTPTTASIRYRIIAGMGQSNVVAWKGPVDPVLDASNTKIFQWGREGADNNQIILATNPLQNATAGVASPPPDTISPVFHFALQMVPTLAANERILIMPLGGGDSGFSNSRWNVGDFLYEDAVTRTIAALADNPLNTLDYVFWNQGERDQAYTEAQYTTAFSTMIADFRTRTGATNVPVISSSVLPASSGYGAGVATAQINMGATVSNYTYVDPTGLTLDADGIHYDAPSIRALGQRYWNAVNP